MSEMLQNSTRELPDKQYLFEIAVDTGNQIMATVVINSKNFVDYCSNSSPVNYIVHEHINVILSAAGVPKRSLLTTEEMVLSTFATIITLIVYFIVFGNSHVKKRYKLAQDLKQAQMQVHYLEEKLTLMAMEDPGKKDREEGGEIRIFMDGAFDMMHYGHMNAFRLGRSLGTHLVVGINSDASVRECKGEPLMNDQERLTMVEGCKFVDEVVPGCPYVMNKEYLDYVIKKYRIDYVIHGDDACIVDGKDVYAAAKESGKFQSIPRTEGVSTTDIIGRMLLMNKDHHYNGSNNGGSENDSSGSNNNRFMLLGQQSKFLTTSRMLRLFSAGVKAPTSDMKVIYIDGAFDMFHPGHVAILKEAKLRGDYLIVGVHGDAIVNRERGSNLPLMNLHERVLSVLGCRFVDDVLIDAPWNISHDVMASLKISEVVYGSRCDGFQNSTSDDERYKHVKEAGKLTVLKSPSDFSLGKILQRIQRNQAHFQSKFERKNKQEKEHFEQKYAQINGDKH
mmetsp:Transcript_1477/g.2354  ORF Transcript_1477/g.2354 Transcript_1477/m.2354 type:complete len:507 (-) Transcript_1477:122-1642(-)